jgi:hypothetical protein
MTPGHKDQNFQGSQAFILISNSPTSYPLSTEHQSFWTPCPDGKAEEYMEMMDKTRNYERRENKALRERLFPLPDNWNRETRSKKYLWVNEAHNGEIRAHVHDFHDEWDAGGLNMRDFLMHATRAPIAGEIKRRIIIVEDMSRRYAEILGVRLNIPPEFFLAHSREALNLSVVDSGYSVQNGRYWCVSIPQKRFSLPISEEQRGWWLIENGFYDRHKVFLDKHD